jgi:hypothetical protein
MNIWVLSKLFGMLHRKLLCQFLYFGDCTSTVFAKTYKHINLPIVLYREKTLFTVCGRRKIYMHKRVDFIVRDSHFKFETWVDFIVRNSPFKLETCWHDIWVLPRARPLFLQSTCKNYVFLKFLLLLSFGWQFKLYEYKNRPWQIEIPVSSNTRDGIIGHQYDKRLESFAPY